MPTIRLTPSTYAVSSTSYLSVTDAENMYTNTDSTTHATITNIYNSTSSRYLYLRGFNFSDIPSAAVVNSFSVKIKGNETSLSTSTSYAPRLANGTSTLSGTTASSNFGTSVSTITIPTGALTWEQISETYGSNFTIVVYVRRSSRNTTGYFYCYGAEIEVDYTVPNPRTITTTLTGDGTIDPSGSTISYDDEEFELTITPTDKTATVTVTQDGVDVTSQLVPHGDESSKSTVLGEYTLVSGSFNGSGDSYFQGLVGKGVDGSQTTSNYYSSSSNTQAVFQYSLAFNNIPSGANITRVYCQVNGHAESTSNSNEYMCVQLKSGNTELSEQINFKTIGTSNTTITLEADTLPTVAQLQSMVLECTLGYYGGAINGATCYAEYDTGGNVDHYTYTFTVSGDSTIAVVIGGSNALYVKQNGSWVQVSAAYKKVNGTWVEQSDLTTVFQSGINYIRR